ncbi:YolD-like family protein [Bacillus songklensis]|uniref:YolD-like family protein n=1 Tax=Bacillus songklensis TaxID=1069116 RepID=A0ABV8B7E4_9BACI
MVKINDRGNLKWQPFLLPEHRSLLKELKKEEQKIEVPMLDQQRLEEFNQTICDAMAFNQPLEVAYYQNGKIERAICHVHYIDIHHRELRTLDKSNHICIIKMDKIIDIQLTDGD